MLLEEKNEIKAEKRVKSKEMKIIEENKKVEMKETKEEKMVQKVKIKYYKKHCKLEIPLIEESLEGIYEINEPIGTLEIRFNCGKSRSFICLHQIPVRSSRAIRCFPAFGDTISPVKHEPSIRISNGSVQSWIPTGSVGASKRSTASAINLNSIIRKL